VEVGVAHAAVQHLDRHVVDTIFPAKQMC
jgi:hypothetical protein